MMEDDVKAVYAIRDAVEQATGRYCSKMDGDQFWSAFKQAMVEYETRRGEKRLFPVKSKAAE